MWNQQIKYGRFIVLNKVYLCYLNAKYDKKVRSLEEKRC